MSAFWKRKRHIHEAHAVELLVASAVRTVKDPSQSLPDAPAKRWHTQLYVTLKSLGLSIVIAWKRRPERRKVAIHQSRRIAVNRCLIHILPLFVALTLLVLNFSNQFLNVAIDHQVPTALQFAAKLHEMTMIASLATVLLSFVSYHLTQSDGLPFGAAFASLQATQLTYVFSPELMGTMRSQHRDWKFKCYLGLTLFTFPILMGTVGPASAACMIPRYRRWQAWSDNKYTGASLTDLFPTNLSSSNYRYAPEPNSELSPGPPSEFDFQSLGLSLFNFSRAYHGLGTNNPFGDFQKGTINYRGPWTTENAGFPFTLSLEVSSPFEPGHVSSSSIQSIVSSDLLVGWSGESIEMRGSMDAFSQADELDDNSLLFDWSTPAPLLNFTSDLLQSEAYGRLTETDVDSMRKSLGALDPRILLESSKPSTESLKDCLSSSSECGLISGAELFFVELQGTQEYGAVFVELLTAGEPPSLKFTIQLTPSNFRLQWLPVVSLSSLNGMSSRLLDDQHDSKRNATASRDWLDLVNPRTLPNGTSAFMYMSKGLERYDAILSSLLTVALSRTMQPHSTVWVQQPVANGLSFHFQSFNYGYGWGPNTLTVQVSLAILTVYCIIAIGHIIYSLWTGVSSTAWDSISEIVALALNSPSPKEMDNTCAGIKTAQVFEHRVRIAAIHDAASEESNTADSNGMETVGRSLALLFSSDEGLIESKVRVNTAYGTTA